MQDLRTLRQLGEFLAQRVEDDLNRAEEAGDKPALSYARGSQELVAALRRDLDERPWARAEVGNYLQRTARLHRHHPDFKSWWL